MIECVAENIKKKKTRGCRARRKRLPVFAVILLLLAALFLYYKYFVAGTIGEVCVKRAQEISVDSVNAAVLDSLSSLKYEDISEVTTDVNGNVAMININAILANKIARTVSVKAKSILENELKGGVPVPSGALTGLKIFSGAGDNIYFKVITVKNVYCDFESDFIDGGVNQTVHRIYLTVKTEMTVVISGAENDTESVSKILLCESLLMGKVPEFIVGK